MRLLLFLLLQLTAGVAALKFLAYNPRLGTSHFTFISRVAETLSDAGHEVVMLVPEVTDKVKIVETKGVRIIKDFLVSEEAAAMAEESMIKSSDMYWTYKSDLDFVEILNTLNTACSLQCNATIHTPGLIEMLRAEKFDAAFAEPIDFCGLGIFHLAGITNYALTMSVSTTEGCLEITGAPTFPSYVPGSMADYSDRMTFMQRVSNTLNLGVLHIFLSTQRALYERVFEAYQPGFPSMMQLMIDSSLFFSNADPLADFPRVTTHKIVEIGGITVAKSEQQLDEKWSSILDLRAHTVLLSFGSAAQASRMPDAYKQAIKSMIGALPEVTFIVKYEKPEHGFSADIQNMVESTWVPQRALLKDPRLSSFITHGGQGSTNEATAAGVPLIVIPLMGDQLRNARTVEHLRTGIKVPKDALSDAGKLTEAVRTILGDPSYKQRAALVASQLRDQPFSAKEKLVRNMEFMAKYGPLRMLDHHGAKLPFYQYYLLDVFLFLGVILMIVVSLIVLCVTCTTRRLFRAATAKRKND